MSLSLTKEVGTRLKKNHKTFARIAEMILLLPAILVVCILFVYPFIHSLINSFRRGDEWGITNYITVWQLYRGDLLYTIWVATVSLTILLILGIFIGGYLRLYKNSMIEFLFKVPLFVPYVVVAHAMRVFLAPNGTLNAVLSILGIIDIENSTSIVFSTKGIVTALVWKNISMVLLLMMGAFRGIDNSYIDAAKNIGAKNLKIIINILVPMAKNSIMVASILIFTSMMGSFSIPAMLASGNDSQMIMVDLYYQIVYQNNYGVANAIGVISYLVSMGAAIYYLKMVTKK
ncbi:MAG: ABC transporter permease subunit [Thermotaleaceae bacterium]